MDSTKHQAGEHSADNPARGRIFLNVLSPSAEVPQKLTYPDISTSTTILELKQKIQNDVETRPAPERQRLIYRGRALVQEEKTLEDIFGHAAVRNSDVFSLHLVLPPLQTQGPHHISNIHSRQALNANVPPDLSARSSPLPSGTATIPPWPASAAQLPGTIAVGLTTPTQGGTGLHPQQNGIPWPGLPSGQGQLPVPVQELLNAHFAALGQPPAGQPSLAAFPPGHGFANVHNHANPWQHPPTLTQFPGLTQPNMHILRAQQQQALFQQQQQQALFQQQHQQAFRAASRQQGTNTTPAQIPEPAVTPHTPLESSPSPTNELPNRVASPGTSSTIIREGQGANGAQWRVVINQSTTTLTPPGANNQLPPATMVHPSSPLTNAPDVPTVSGEGAHFRQPPNITEMSATRQAASSWLGGGSYRPNNLLTNVQQGLFQIERSLDQQNLPVNSQIQLIAHQLQLLRSQHPDLPPGLETSLRIRLSDIERRTAHMANQYGHSMTQAVNGAGTIQNASPISSTNTTVYLLSSPTGPHALMVAPSGIYSSSVSTPASQVINRMSQGTNSVINANLAQNQVPEFNNEQEIRDIQDIQIVQARGQQQQEQQPDQVGDLARLLLPLGGHLWLLVRLFGFVYFFTSGAGWYRTILLCACAIVVFMGQTGVFRPIQQALWDPFRRHIEGLVPLAGNNGDNDGGGVNEQRPAIPLPTPQQVAERLLRERNDQNNGLIRRSIRRFERATALFVASLVPGVGERHIAARDAADAARQAVEREREEQARRDEEARVQIEAVGRGNNQHDAFVDREGHAPPHTNTGQQPVLEI